MTLRASISNLGHVLHESAFLEVPRLVLLCIYLALSVDYVIDCSNSDRLHAYSDTWRGVLSIREMIRNDDNDY